MSNPVYDEFDCDVFSSRLRAEVKKLGANQAIAARKLGISEPVLSFYLTGKRAPCARSLYRLSRRLGVSADWLLGLADERCLK